MLRFLTSAALYGALVAAAGAQPMTFVDVTVASGLDYAQNGLWASGVAIGDYDGDGWHDVLLCGSDGVGTKLFRNNGDRTFTDVTAAVLPADTPDTNYALFADLDNDGDADLVMAVWYAGFLDTGFGLLENVGGAYVHGSTPIDLARHASRIGGSALSDADRDGDLDVVQAHYFGPGFYLRNDGDLSFVDDSAGFDGNLSVSKRHWTAVMADFNLDGWPDLHTAIDFGHDYHAHGIGGGAYADVSTQVGVSNIGADMGVTAGDIDNDGDLDMYSTNIGVHCLYVNDGAGNFVNEAKTRGCEKSENNRFGFGWGCAFVDFDHDRDLDLLMLTDAGDGSLYSNDGAGNFSYANTDAGLETQGYGLVHFDYDRDGDEDLVMTDLTGSTRIYENTAPGNAKRHWLIVDPEGTTSNRDGVGARIRVRTGSLIQTREIQAGTSFNSGNPYYAHFGLDRAKKVDLEITWPSGVVQRLQNVAVDRYLTVVEP